jgi:SagB-type dehydrogenase family enzyme
MKNFLARLFHTEVRDQFIKYSASLTNPAYWPKEWTQVQFKEYSRFPKVPLPRASSALPALDSLLARRKSTRAFTQREVDVQTLSTLLYYAAGINETRSSTSDILHSVRNYPSGGALYPLEIYLALHSVPMIEPGIYHYNVKEHCLEKIANSSYANTLKEKIYPWAAVAPITLFISSIWKRNFQKYKNYGYSMTHIEAGHLAQNIQLVAEALQLSYCSYLGFDAKSIEEILNLEPEGKETVIYATSIGSGKSM